LKYSFSPTDFHSQEVARRGSCVGRKLQHHQQRLQHHQQDQYEYVVQSIVSVFSFFFFFLTR
jgi:hypothetical protein